MENTIFKHTLYFPTLCLGVGVGQGFKTIEVKIELRNTQGKDWETMENGEFVELSICASAKGHAGQCLDYIQENGSKYIIPPEYKELWDRVYYMWKHYHLNTLHAGTKWQEEFFEELTKETRMKYPEEFKKKSKYDMITKGTLAEEGLGFTNEYKPLMYDYHTPNANGYKYGSSWLSEKIPDDIIEEIKSWYKYSKPDATEVKMLRRKMRREYKKETNN